MTRHTIPRKILKEIFRLFYKDGLNTFEIKEEIKKEFDKNISANRIVEVLASDLSKLYKDINIDKKPDRFINKQLLDVRNKEREANKDIIGDNISNAC